MNERKWLLALAACAVAFFGIGYMAATYEQRRIVQKLLEEPSPQELRVWLNAASASEQSLSQVDPRLRQAVVGILTSTAITARQYAMLKVRPSGDAAGADAILKDVEAAEKLIEKLRSP